MEKSNKNKLIPDLNGVPHLMSSGVNVKGSARKFVGVDPSKCIGCGLCELICVLEKGEDSLSPLRSRIHVVRILPFFNVVTACRFCENAPCVKACPRNALFQNEVGLISCDQDKCDRCGWCAMACPYGAITLHPDRPLALICDLCNGEPRCIELCPAEALSLVSEDEAESMWKTSIEQLLMKVEKLLSILKARDVASLFEGVDQQIRKFYWKYMEMDKKYPLKRAAHT